MGPYSRLKSEVLVVHEMLLHRTHPILILMRMVFLFPFVDEIEILENFGGSCPAAVFLCGCNSKRMNNHTDGMQANNDCVDEH